MIQDQKAASDIGTETPPAQPHWRMLMVVYGAWSLVASLLIFWVELMVAKMLLPRFGGSASVWNTALVFFQVILLAGYAVAHWLARLDSRRHKIVQLALVTLPVLTLPVALPLFLETPSMGPTLAVLVALTIMIGAPFFALSTSTPTLQTWFSHSGHPRASDPYFLYALSNVGSLLGLFGYPLIVEPLLTIRAQSLAWTGGYILFIVTTLAGARLVGRWSTGPVMVETVRPPLDRRIRWAAIAFVPSLLLLGVTRHLSTDVAAFPLMWTIPLALYLASFVLTFGPKGESRGRVAERMLRLLLIPAALILLVPNALWLNVALPLALLATVSIAAHGKVYADRPAPESLTHFYLWVSIGGAVGGLFAALVAPIAFDFVIEYPLGLVLAALLTGGALRKSPFDVRIAVAVALAAMAAGLVVADNTSRVLILAIGGLIAVLWAPRIWTAVVVGMMLVAASMGGFQVVDSERTFFGVYRVLEFDDSRFLMSGTTSHGMQVKAEATRNEPVFYYHADGPVGDVFSSLPDGPRDVGIIGLGVGGLNSYVRSGDSFTYYEIDPVVEDFARDTRYFTFLADAAEDTEVVIGDGRLELERIGPTHDLLVLDAFASDAIPLHLITLEAFETYLRSLDEDGVVLVHISNRHLNLEPVIGRIAEELGAVARVLRYNPPPDLAWSVPSVWVMVEPVETLDLPDDWTEAAVGSSLWTDDFSNIVSVIKWGVDVG